MKWRQGGCPPVTRSSHMCQHLVEAVNFESLTICFYVSPVGIPDACQCFLTSGKLPAAQDFMEGQPAVTDRPPIQKRLSSRPCLWEPHDAGQNGPCKNDHLTEFLKLPSPMVADVTSLKPNFDRLHKSTASTTSPTNEKSCNNGHTWTP